MRRRYGILLMLLLAISCASAQKITRVNAIKANNYGVIYALPKTSFEVTFVVKKTTYHRGEFYPYAQRYLGIDNPIMENETRFTLEDVMVANKGIADKENSFMVEFRGKTVEPFVYLREDGVILTINAEATEQAPVEKFKLPEKSAPLVNPRRFLSQETLMAGSTAKQAELIARQVFDLRRNRSDILSGEAENMPPDGNAYKMVMEEIDIQEKALTELFSGSVESEYFTVSYTFIPGKEDINGGVIARFSGKLGPVDADNLAGEPVRITLTNKTPVVPLQLNEKELKQLESKLSEGIVYNVPGKADLVIEFQNKLLYNKEVDVVQYGSQDVLARRMFENQKQPIQVHFHPELGAIKQIIQ
ncbi:MAG: DUF4831 family protein [Bacteroidota bacterium]|nr:DUF4831 family protein [Bacteroidota bacterium]